MAAANESVLQSDGSQCVAAADYNDPAVALAGPDGSGQFLLVYISDSRTVAIVTGVTVAHYGILQNRPELGQAADVAISGITKAVAGNTITAGAELMADTNTGRLVPWTAGGGRVKVGVALEAVAATAANKIFTMRLYPSPAKLLT